MSVYREKSRSCWMEIQPPIFVALDKDITCDVAVVGSGIAGLSTAYELTKAGRSVVILDRGLIGRGMTARTTAHLASWLDDYYHEFISIRGEEMARMFYASQAGAIDRIEEITVAEGLACDFSRLEGLLFLAGGAGEDILDKELEAIHKIGIPGVELKFSPAGHGLSDGPYLVIPEQGRFHPLKYVDGLADVLKQVGAGIYAGTCVTKINETKDGVEIETAGGRKVSAGAAVVATNGPIMDKAKVSVKEIPARTYAFAAELAKGTVEDRLYWDTEDPYHYVRLQPLNDIDLLISGGEDHHSGEADNAEERFARLERWTRDRFPEMGRIRQRWSGQVLEPVDYVGFIGLSPGSERIYLVTGDSGQGITHGVAASLVLVGLIDKGTHPWAEVFAPGRKPVGAVGNFLGAAAGAVKGLAEHITGSDKDTDGEIKSADQLGPGEGAVIREGKDKLAVSRDEGGRLHRLKAACSHMGCVVHWNSFEQCWDCPCHGSQFAPDGTALNGPAIQPLKAASESAEEKTVHATSS
jgi:glycine/D-amino acid oxidase-like deaminating enzyme/nitrite reductase/ring-hydroxylating ferredoxin subunit